jgi:hypothetical protein
MAGRAVAGRVPVTSCDLPIGQRQDARQPRPRNLRECAVDRGHQPRALVAALRHVQRAEFEIRACAPIRASSCRTGGIHLHAVTGADACAIAAILYQQGDVRAAFARFLHQAGLASAQQRAARRRAPATTRPVPRRHQGGHQRQQRQPGRARPAATDRQDRREVDSRRWRSASVAQPFQNGGHVHLVALVVAGQRVHHEVDAEAVGQRSAAAPRRG